MIQFLLLLILISQPLLSGEDPFVPFTAKVAKRKVRLRTKPELDSPIARELSLHDLVVIDGESDEFYQVRPPYDLKLYLFRTFVLDGMVEGNRVNVRLSPDLESPVIAQLNTGDSVSGHISSLHPKWMEIIPPSTVRFFVSKDFVEKVGDEGYLAFHQKRGMEVKKLLAFGKKGYDSLNDPFESLSIENITAPFQEILDNYREFEQEVLIAQESIRELREQYLFKKVAYLEGKASALAQAAPPLPQVLIQEEHLSSQEPLASLDEADELSELFNLPAPPPLAISPRSYWVEIEKNHFKKWREEHGGKGDPESFYSTQASLAEPLVGILEPYLRPVRQKPGDFVLLDVKSREPIAYLYTTKMNLVEMIGKEVSIKGLARPNNQFTHPAYFVWEID